MKEPQAVIMQSWIEPTIAAVPDPAERCRVWEYAFAESMFLAFGIEHNEPKPEGAGAVAVAFLLPQLQRVCGAYAARSGQIERKRAERAGGNPCAPTCADNSPYACADNQNKTKQNKTPPIPPTDAELFGLGVELIRCGKRIESASSLREVCQMARQNRVRKLAEYVCKCIHTDYADKAQAAAVANFLQFVGVSNPHCLELAEISARDGVLILRCSQECADCIETAADNQTISKNLQDYMRSVGARTMQYKSVN